MCPVRCSTNQQESVEGRIMKEDVQELFMLAQEALGVLRDAASREKRGAHGCVDCGPGRG